MTFYLDEDVNIELALFLQIQGHRAITTLQAKNLGNHDNDQLIYATQQNASLITHNRRHFRSLHREWTESGKHHHGIILTRQLPLSELERRMKSFLTSAFGLKLSDRIFDLRDFT